MNTVFTALVGISLITLLFTSPQSALQAITSASSSTVALCLKMVGIYAIWLAVMKLIEACKLADGLSRLLRPVIRFLFEPMSEKGKYYTSMNMSANILGLGNAATPMGISATNELRESTYNLAMLMVINATSIQILPTTVLSLLTEYGSINSASIVLPSLLATVASTVVGVLLVMVFYRKKKV